MALRSMLLLLLTSVSVDAFAGCEVPTKNAQLTDTLDRSKIAFADLDIETFDAAIAEARDQLTCLREPLSLSGAAEFHRMTGIAAFLSRNSPKAQLSFATARSIEPSFVFPTDMVPEGNPVLKDYRAIDPAAGPFVILLPPETGSVRLDGSSALKRNKPLPVIFQLLDASGAVSETKLVEGGAPLPSYPVAAKAPGPGASGGSGPNKPLLIGAGAAVLAAGGLYGVSLASRGGYNKSDTLDGLDGKRSLTNGLVIGSGVAGAVAIGLGTTSFLLSGTF